MNIRELKSILKEKKLGENIVSFNEGDKISGYNIQEVHGLWRFLGIDDKGNIDFEKTFQTEDDLCKWVLAFEEEKQRSYNTYKRTPPRESPSYGVIYL